MSIEYTPDRIANVAKSVQGSYARMRKDSMKLLEYVDAGIAAGHSTGKIEHDMLSRCSTREEVVDVLSVLKAAKAMRDQGTSVRP